MGIRTFIGAVFAAFVFATSAFAADYNGKNVTDVEIAGTITIGTDKVISKIKTRPGQPYMDTVISEDIKRIYDLNFFDDINVDVKENGDGTVKVVFNVTEKIIVNKITFSEYKRRQAAPGLKVSARAFGIGRRIPVAQRYRS